MTEELHTDVTELAKAVKTTAEAVEAIEKTNTGKFVGRVFGGILEDGLGMVGDAIKFKRIELYERHVQKTKENLAQRGIDWERDDVRVVPPKIAIPVFENASLEEAEDLHTHWSNLLANAMDPSFEFDIKIRHVAILKEMEPLDLRILSECYKGIGKRYSVHKLNEKLFDKYSFVKKFGIDENDAETSILNLMRLGCAKGGNIEVDFVSFGDMNNTIYTGTKLFSISLLGVQLCEAASV